MIHKLIAVAAWTLLAFIAYATISPIQARPTLFASPSFERLAAFTVLGVLFCLAYCKAPMTPRPMPRNGTAMRWNARRASLASCGRFSLVAWFSCLTLFARGRLAERATYLRCQPRVAPEFVLGAVTPCV